MSTIRREFNKEFLIWLRQSTEEAWARRRSRTFQDYVQTCVGGVDWQQGTRWIGGLSESEIIAIEARNHFKFPKDYRLFLSLLHATDRPMVGAAFVDGHRMQPIQRPGFYNWLVESESIHLAIENIFQGLLFDVEKNGLWLEIWGPRPQSEQVRKTTLRDHFESAPPLIPVFGHRFILGEAGWPGNPVLSIYQSDIIIYGVDLRSYLLIEFGDLIGVSGDFGNPPDLDYSTIPFWGQFLR